MIVFCLSRTLKVALIGLEISFQEWFFTIKNLGCEASSNFCVTHEVMRSHSLAALSELVRYDALSCPRPQKHQPTTLLKLLCIFGNVFCVPRYFCSLPGFFHSKREQVYFQRCACPSVELLPLHPKPVGRCLHPVAPKLKISRSVSAECLRYVLPSIVEDFLRLEFR